MLDDVVAALDRLRQTQGARFSVLGNELLRKGRTQMRARPVQAAPFRTRSVDLGRPRLGNVDHVADVLATAEDEAFG